MILTVLRIIIGMLIGFFGMKIFLEEIIWKGKYKLFQSKKRR